MTELARTGTAKGRGIIFATVLGSGVSFLDGLVVNIALPQMDADLSLGITGFQWVVSGYLLTLSALILLGGSLGDTYGRRRIYVIGISLFGLTSVLCGLAPNAFLLIVARLLQGVAGALMIPASLAVIQASFVKEDRGKAIGLWTGVGAGATAIGPFVGGFFVTYVSWRWAFLINVPLCSLAVWAALRWVPESSSVQAGGTRKIDWVGALLAGLGLAGVTYWAIEATNEARGAEPLIVGLLGITALVSFVLWEKRVDQPMLPMSMFSNSQFSWVNLCTFLLYGAFITGTTLSGIRLQTELGYSAFEAGLASWPVTVLMFFLAGRFGALAQRVGPRWLMTAGPVLIALGLFGMSEFEAGRSYLTFVMPVMIIWGFGLAMVVAPLTAAALGSADQNRTGIASAFNNAASRVGSTIGIAIIPLMAGMSGGASLSSGNFQTAYGKAVFITAGFALLSGLVAALFIRSQRATAE